MEVKLTRLAWQFDSWQSCDCDPSCLALASRPPVRRLVKNLHGKWKSFDVTIITVK